MRNRKLALFLGIILLISLAGLLPLIQAEAPSANAILEKVDKNHDYQTAYSEGRMEITIGSRKIIKSMRFWYEGKTKAFVEYTSKRDEGTRVLKLGDDLWLYSPAAENEVKLSGELLKQGMGGSDFSYQDALEGLHLTDLYQVNLQADETVNNRPCYVLELTAKNGVEVSYFRRKMWIDKERLVDLKQELYAPSGKLMKLMTVEKVEQFGSRFYPTITVMEDKLRKNSNTRFVIEKIEFNVPIPAGTFTRQRLTGK